MSYRHLANNTVHVGKQPKISGRELRDTPRYIGGSTPEIFNTRFYCALPLEGPIAKTTRQRKNSGEEFQTSIPASIRLTGTILLLAFINFACGPHEDAMLKVFFSTLPKSITTTATIHGTITTTGEGVNPESLAVTGFPANAVVVDSVRGYGYDHDTLKVVSDLNAPRAFPLDSVKGYFRVLPSPEMDTVTLMAIGFGMDQQGQSVQKIAVNLPTVGSATLSEFSADTTGHYRLPFAAHPAFAILDSVDTLDVVLSAGPRINQCQVELYHGNEFVYSRPLELNTWTTIAQDIDANTALLARVSINAEGKLTLEQQVKGGVVNY